RLSRSSALLLLCEGATARLGYAKRDLADEPCFYGFDEPTAFKVTHRSKVMDAEILAISHKSQHILLRLCQLRHLLALLGEGGQKVRRRVAVSLAVSPLNVFAAGDGDIPSPLRDHAMLPLDAGDVVDRTRVFAGCGLCDPHRLSDAKLAPRVFAGCGLCDPHRLSDAKLALVSRHRPLRLRLR